MTRGRSRSPNSVAESDGGTEFLSLANGRQLAYSEYGDPAGAPVIFLHGTPGSRLLGALFDDQAADSDVRLRTLEGADHVQALLRSVPDLLNEYR